MLCGQAIAVWGGAGTTTRPHGPHGPCLVQQGHCSGQCKGNLDAESAVVRRGQCKRNLNERAVVRRGQCKEVNESGSMVLALAAALIVAAIAAGDHTATSPTQSSGQAARQRRNASHEQHVT